MRGGSRTSTDAAGVVTTTGAEVKLTNQERLDLWHIAQDIARRAGGTTHYAFKLYSMAREAQEAIDRDFVEGSSDMKNPCGIRSLRA